MSEVDFVREVQSLFGEKHLKCSPEVVGFLRQVSRDLTRRGVPLNREVLDFTIDVIRVKALVGLAPGASDDEVQEAREEMADWLEALGWRRAWFTRDVSRVG